MPYGTQDAAVKLNPTQEAEVSKLTSVAEITAYLHELEVQQGLRAYDAIAKESALPVNGQLEQPIAKPTSRPVTINGVTYEISGATPEEQRTSELEIYRKALGDKTPALQDQLRDDQGRFVSADDAAQKAAEEQQHVVEMVELELKFKRGEISARDYLEQSGAVDEYLASRGVDVDALAAYSEAERMQLGNAAVQEFLQNSDWPGGTENEATMKALLEEANCQITAANLQRAYDYMKAEGLVKPNAEIERDREQRKALESARDIEDIRQIYGSPAASGLWNR